MRYVVVLALLAAPWMAAPADGQTPETGPALLLRVRTLSIAQRLDSLTRVAAIEVEQLDGGERYGEYAEAILDAAFDGGAMARWVHFAAELEVADLSDYERERMAHALQRTFRQADVSLSVLRSFAQQAEEREVFVPRGVREASDQILTDIERLRGYALALMARANGG